jgi:hypothetical protein
VTLLGAPWVVPASASARDRDVALKQKCLFSYEQTQRRRQGGEPRAASRATVRCGQGGGTYLLLAASCVAGVDNRAGAAALEIMGLPLGLGGTW